MLSLQSQLCAIRGSFHLCFKGNKQHPKKKEKKKRKFIGLKSVSYNAGFCLYTILKPVGSKVSAAPYQA